MNLSDIENKIDSIDDNSLLNAKDIANMGLILDNNLNPSRFKLYRLIKRGKLKAINNGTEAAPNYFVKGRDLKKFLRERYNLEILA